MRLYRALLTRLSLCEYKRKAGYWSRWIWTSNIQAYPPDQYVAIIVLRPKIQDKATVLAYIQRLIALLRERTPAGELWIVQRDRIRVRKAD
jgi:hypothetical protein